MRIPSVLLAILFGFASLDAAPATDQSQPTPSSAAPSVKSRLLNSAAEAKPIGKSNPPNERQHDFDIRNLGSILGENDRDKVCYRIRSYIVSRENRDSDSTKLVGYSTCQPSSKYDLRIRARTRKSNFPVN
jgi:hypothetical protein